MIMLIKMNVKNDDHNNDDDDDKNTTMIKIAVMMMMINTITFMAKIIVELDNQYQ